MDAITPAVRDDQLHPYEERAVLRAASWVGRDSGVGDRALGGASAKTRWLLDGVLERDEVRERIAQVTDQILRRAGEALAGEGGGGRPALLDARPEGGGASLPERDREASRLHSGCVAAMTLEGVAAGAASMTPVTAVISFLPDLAAALTISTTSAARMLVLYGAALPGPAALEAGVRAAALGTETDPGARRAQFLELTDLLATGDSDRAAPEEVSQLVAQQVAVRAVRETVEQTVRRVARRRIAAFVPVVGIAVHAAASGWLGQQVCEASRHVGTVAYVARRTGRSPVELVGAAAGR